MYLYRVEIKTHLATLYVMHLRYTDGGGEGRDNAICVFFLFIQINIYGHIVQNRAQTRISGHPILCTIYVWVLK